MRHRLTSSYMRHQLTTSLRSVNPTQLFLELVIVFLGVYLAFLFSSYRANSERLEEREKAIELIDIGIDRYQNLFEQFVLGHQARNAEFRKSLDRNEIPNFGGATYPAPQYPIDAITYIVTSESYDLFQVDFYVPLTAYLNGFERLMYVEEKLVQLSEKYQPLPRENHPDYAYLRAIQFQHAQQYLRYLEIRKNICQELVDKSIELNQLIANR